MRPLWFEYPNDKQTYLIDDEYLVGKDILVAPVLKEGQTIRGIYLPKGDEWMDWWTGERLESGKIHYLQTPIERVPIYVRVGAVIPTQPTIQHTGEMPKVDLTLNVITGIAPDKTETSEVFQDAGEGYGYRKSDWRDVKIEHKKGILQITRVGNYNGSKIKFIEAVGIAQKPREIRVDGKLVENVDFDATRKILKIEIGENAREIILVP